MGERIRHIQGDNADVMRSLAEVGERFTLAYLDPPFFTGRDFATSDGEHAYSDRWPSLEAYLEAVMERARLAFDLLTDSGSIVIHVDPTVSHYVKVEGDKLFGRSNFASEIVWRYRRWPTPTRNFQAMHDVLLRWVTGRGAPAWNQLYEPPSASTVRAYGNQKQKADWNAGTGTAKKRARSVSTDDVSPGAALSDVWEVGIISGFGNERTGYPTQKPEALLSRLILSVTNEGDAVLDPYMGSGTTLAVCHRLNRRAVGIDASPVAIRHTQERLGPMLRQTSLFDLETA